MQDRLPDIQCPFIPHKIPTCIKTLYLVEFKLKCYILYFTEIMTVQ